nr:hypothetical protein [Tanacetum cinerariifolium]
ANVDAKHSDGCGLHQDLGAVALEAVIEGLEQYHVILQNLRIIKGATHQFMTNLRFLSSTFVVDVSHQAYRPSELERKVYFMFGIAADITPVVSELDTTYGFVGLGKLNEKNYELRNRKDNEYT